MYSWALFPGKRKSSAPVMQEQKNNFLFDGQRQLQENYFVLKINITKIVKNS